MSTNIDLIAPDESVRLRDGAAVLTDLSAEFPDWCFKSRDTSVIVFEVARVFTDVLPRLVEALNDHPGGELLFLDTELEPGTTEVGSPARSFRVRSGATSDEVWEILRGDDARFGLGADSLVGLFDFLIVTPWCEVRGFLPDYALVGFRDHVPHSITRIFEPHAWDLDGLLQAMGAAWWRPTSDQPVPDMRDIAKAVPADVRARVEHNYSRLNGRHV